MPVICSISLNNLNAEHFRPQERPSWEKARRHNLLNDYTFAVSHMLWPIKIPNLDATTNDTLQFYNKILEILTQAAKETIPNIKYNRHAKPYWSESVKKCHADMSYHRGLWINEGRPRGMQFVTFRLYKKAKDKFRITLQNAYSIYETEFYNSLDAACDVDQKTLWSALRNKRRSSYIRSLKISDKIITLPVDVCNEMADHFSKVFSDGAEDDFDNNFKLNLEAKVSAFKANAVLSDEVFSISPKLVNNICSKLPNNKSCGLDGISYEHIKYGGSYLFFCLARLYSLLINNCCIPEDWHRGVLVCIYKGHSKSKLNPDSYRGITLLSVIFKIFEKVLESLMPPLSSSADYPNTHQCGFQKGLSSIDASFVLQETINHYKERNDGSCVAFLDSSKAFDTVWHTGLLYKLSEIEIPPKIWLILYRIYNNAKSCVFVNKHFSHYFRQHRGLCQGSILSPKLYVLYINNLLNMLSHSNKGYMILDVHVSCPTQADDIAIISPSPSNMQNMLLTCQQYSLKWRFRFSSLKSQVVNFCKDTDPHILLYENELPCTHSIKHVGTILNKDLNNWDRTVAACKTIKSTSMILLQSGCHPHGLNPATSLKIVNSLCLAKALYGCELWNNITKHELLALERAFRFAIKNIQGLPKRTRTDICLGLVGAISIEARIDIHKLTFFTTSPPLSCMEFAL